MVEIEHLARKAYHSSMALPSNLLLQWYKRNPSMWWLAKENNRLVGYMCAIPLKNEAFRKTLRQEFNESTDITIDDIRTWNDGFDSNYAIYLCSMVVDPDFRTRSDLPICRTLAKYFFESLLSYGKNGSIVKEWSGLAVSEAGRHLSQNYFDLTFVTSDLQNNTIGYAKTNTEHQEELLQRIQQKSLS